MNLLIDELPESLTVCGRAYKIRTDFRISLLYEILMQDETMTFDERCQAALDLYYYEIPPDGEEAMMAVIWFYSGGRQQSAAPAKGGKKQKQIYSFEHDDAYIYAAFLQQYGIDLNSIPHLHWWKFSALFQAIDSKCQFSKIMGYRAMDISPDMPQKQREFYREMQELYKLPIPEKEQEALDAIEEALLSGGDLTEVL